MQKVIVISMSRMSNCWNELVRGQTQSAGGGRLPASLSGDQCLMGGEFGAQRLLVQSGTHGVSGQPFKGMTSSVS